eukprot:scpid78852/ scgid11575/ 
MLSLCHTAIQAGLYVRNDLHFFADLERNAIERGLAEIGTDGNRELGIRCHSPISRAGLARVYLYADKMRIASLVLRGNKRGFRYEMGRTDLACTTVSRLDPRSQKSR